MIMDLVERAVSALEGVSINLSRIANVQEAILRAGVQEAAEEIIPAPVKEAPKAETQAPVKEAPRKARVERRAAVRDAAKDAGLSLKTLQQAVGAQYNDWTAEHCLMIEGMTAEQVAINEAAALEKANAIDGPIEEPTLTEAPAEAVQEVTAEDLDADDPIEPEVLPAEEPVITVDTSPSDDAIRAAVVAYANTHGKEAAKKLIKEVGGAEKLAEVPDRAHWVALYHAVKAREAA